MLSERSFPYLFATSTTTECVFIHFQKKSHEKESRPTTACTVLAHGMAAVAVWRVTEMAKRYVRVWEKHQENADVSIEVFGSEY